MTDVAELLEEVLAMRRDLDKVRTDLANMVRVGPVTETDPEKGIRVAFGTEKDPDDSAWTKSSDRSGVSSYRPAKGEQMMVIALGGDGRQAIAIPLTHSDAKPDPKKDPDETVHHNRDGQRSSVKKGHVKNQADKKHSKFVGDEPKAGGGGDKVIHELNKQLQGLRAEVTQHTNSIAGLHDAASKMREIAEKVIPQLQTLKPILDGDAASLEKAAKGVLGKLESFVASSMKQAVGKLTNGFMGNVMGLVQGMASGEIGGILDQVADLASANGLESLAADALDEARGMIGQAAGGAVGQLAGPMGQLASTFAGTPAEAAFGLLQGQLNGALGDIAKVAGALGGLLDGQQNLVKGMTKSYRLGGYEGDD